MDIIFFKIDCDECEEISEDYDIKSMPTIVYVKETKEIKRQEGLKKKEEIVKIIKEDLC